MHVQVNGAAIYCYTGGKAFDAAKPTVVFIHRVLNDHSVWALQSRYMANHRWNVLAIDLPGHCRSVALALGEVTPGQIARVLQEAAQPPEPPAVTQSGAPVASRHATLDHSALRIEGIGNLLTTLARCCQRLPGDPVRGFITKGRGVSVHRADCGSLARLAWRSPDRVIEVGWGSAASQAYEVDIELRGYDRKGLQKDVTSVVSNGGTHIIASSSRLFVRTGEVEMRFTLRVRDFDQLPTLLGKLLALPNVLEVRRVGVG